MIITQKQGENNTKHNRFYDTSVYKKTIQFQQKKRKANILKHFTGAMH